MTARTAVFLTFFLTALLLQSCVTKQSGFVRPPDSCFKQQSYGEEIAPECGSYEVMTQRMIEESIADFRNFENSDLGKKVKLLSMRNASQRQVTSNGDYKIISGSRTPFGRSIEEEVRISQLPKADRGEIAKRDAKILNELYPQANSTEAGVQKWLNWMKGDKYLVRLTFANNVNFPRKKGSSEYFADNESQSFKEMWRQKIYRHYLGEGYEKYQPNLNKVTSSVVIKVLVKSSGELSNLFSGKPIQAINHIGGAIESLEVVLP